MAIWTYVRNAEAKNPTNSLILNKGALTLRMGQYANLTATEVAEIKASGQYIIEEGIIFPATPAESESPYAGVEIPEWTATGQYIKSQAVLHGGKIYIARKNLEPESVFTESNWEVIVGSGAVASVNSFTGVVTLTYANVGADKAGAAKEAQEILENDIRLEKEARTKNEAVLQEKLTTLESDISSLSGNSKPVVILVAATGVISTQATLHAEVNPEGTSGIVFICNGVSTSMGNISGTTLQPIQLTVTGTGFTEKTKWNVKATNAVGSSEGVEKELGALTAAPIITYPSTAQENFVGESGELVPTTKNSITKFEAVGLTSGMSINSSTGKITFTSLPTVEKISVEVKATGSGGTGIFLFTWNVKATVVTTVKPKIINSVAGSTAYLEVNGSPFVFKGMTCWLTEDHITTPYGGEQYAQLSKIASVLHSWGVNCVRVRILENNYEEEKYMKKEAYVQQNKNIVEEFTKLGIYVMFCSWGSSNPDGKYGGPEWAGHANYGEPLFKALYESFGTNPYVIWEPWNEPHEISEAQWKTNWETTIAYFRETLHYYGVICVGPNSWSNSGTGGAGYSATLYEAIMAYDAARSGMGGVSNLMWAKHDYANDGYGGTWNASSWEAAVGGSQVKFVICETEIGNYNGSEASVSAPWSKAALEFFKNLSLTKKNYCGAFPFLMGPWYDKNAITLAGNETPTSPWGEEAKEFEGGLITGSEPIAPVITTNGKYAEWQPQAGVTVWKIAISTESSAHTERGTAYTSQAQINGQTQKFTPVIGQEYTDGEFKIIPTYETTYYVGVAAETPSGPFANLEADPTTEKATGGNETSTSSLLISLHAGNWGTTSYSDIASTGVKHVRLAEGFQTEGEIGLAAASGISLSSTIFGEGPTLGNINAAEYAKNFVAFFKKFGKGGSFWAGKTEYPTLFGEICNEPYNSSYWTDSNNYSAYAALCKATYELVGKEFTTANRPLVLASWGGNSIGAGEAFGPGVKSAGGYTYCDGVVTHPYNGSTLTPYWPLVEKAHTETGKNIYITEVGWAVLSSGGGISEAEQATAIHNSCEEAKTRAYVKLVTIYEYIDESESNKFGVETRARVHRSSFTKLGEAAKEIE